MTAAFAIGVLGGLLGSPVLDARRAAAVPVLAASRVGHVTLFCGDVVFDAIPGQLAILAFVVFVAVARLGTVWAACSRGLLR